MLCPYCSNPDSKVTDKRDIERLTKRRRECLKCSRRFSTHERVELSEIKVIKKNGKAVFFERDKLRKGISRACEKRPVKEERIENMLNKIENKLRLKKSPAKTSYIGELVSRELKKADKIAYIRFASVYRDFADLSDFKKEIKDLIKN